MDTNILKVLSNVEYADALKEALVKRSSGQIGRAEDDVLGIFLYNISRWGVSDCIKSKLLPAERMGDTDLIGEVLVALLSKLPKADLTKTPKEIIVYLFRVARSAARDIRAKETAIKRQHEDVELSSAVLTSDFYGRRINNQVAFDNDRSSDNE